MARGIQSKELASIERLPENNWVYYCNGETIKTCKNKKSFQLWIKLHLKNCISCQQRELFLSDSKIQTSTGKLQ